MIYDLDTNNSWLIANSPEFYGYVGNGCISPDDKWVTFSHKFNIWVVSSNGNDEPIKITDYYYGFSDPWDNNWFPNGRWILFDYDCLGGIFKLKVSAEFLP
ncbi:MAG: TolB family protein [bacterium]